jgi:hypothetical protein
MPSAVKLRTDFTAGELRRLAKKAKDVSQSRRLLSKSGSRTRPASVKRMASSANGLDADRDRASLPTSVTRAPISLARSVRRAAKARRSHCPSLTHSPCSLHLDEISRHVADGAHVRRPTFNRIKGDDTDRVCIFTTENSIDDRSLVGPCLIYLTPGAAQLSEVLQHLIHSDVIVGRNETCAPHQKLPSRNKRGSDIRRNRTDLRDGMWGETLPKIP